MIKSIKKNNPIFDQNGCLIIFIEHANFYKYIFQFYKLRADSDFLSNT